MSKVRPVARAKPKHAKHKSKRAHAAARPAGETDNARIAFEYFKSKGLTDAQAAGVVGNLDHESNGVNPMQHQIGGPAQGIGQWEHPRWSGTPGDNVVDFAKKENASPYALQTQLDFTWYELNHGYGLAALQRQTTVTGATDSFEKTFEGAGKPQMADRYARANAAYAAFANGGGSRRITKGEDSVLAGPDKQPVAHVDSPDSGGGKVKAGSSSVFVGPQKLPAARVGDPTKIRPGSVVEGDSSILVGG